jgi:hypothetical protein
LAQIAIVVNDLVDREAMLQKCAAMKQRGLANLGGRCMLPAGWPGYLTASQRCSRLLDAQSLDQLVEE